MIRAEWLCAERAVSEETSCALALSAVWMLAEPRPCFALGRLRKLSMRAWQAQHEGAEVCMRCGDAA